MEREIIFGPPGTGKTQTLIEKVAKLLNDGMETDQLGYVSFSKKANLESIARAQKIGGFTISEWDLPYFRTLHSLAFRQLGIDPKTQLMKSADYNEFAEWIGIINFETEDSMDESGMIISKNQYLNQINLARYKCIPLRQQYDLNEHNGKVWWHTLEKIARALPEWKKKAHKYDFTDVIEIAVAKKAAPRLKVLFVDEAQDLNRLQWNYVHVLEEKSEKSFIAGDDDQAIYTFQGADVDHFLGLEGKKTILTQSHRVPRKVYELAQMVVGRLSKRQVKTWTPRPEDGEVHWINSLRSIDFKEGKTLVLASANYMLNKVKDYLESWGYAYQTRGHRGIKEGFIETLLEWEQWRSKARLPFESVKRIYGNLTVKDKQLRRGFKGCKTLMPDKSYTMEECKKDHGLLEDRPWADALHCDVRTVNYIEAMQRNGEDISKPPRITLSTIHAAKGGESGKVALMQDISWNATKAYEANPDPIHRQFYTGITRTQHTLYVLSPDTRNYYKI